jgi:hypothetical protein
LPGVIRFAAGPPSAAEKSCISGHGPAPWTIRELSADTATDLAPAAGTEPSSVSPVPSAAIENTRIVSLAMRPKTRRLPSGLQAPRLVPWGFSATRTAPEPSSLMT